MLSDLWLFAVLGFGTGALIAALGMGVALTYRGSGVVNLASGAVAMYTAYTYWGLRTGGRWAIPPLPNPLTLVEGISGWFGASLALPDWPTWVTIGDGWATTPAFVGAIATAAVLGVALHALVFRPLRAASALAKVVATVGVFLVLQAVVVRRFGSTALSVEPMLPSSSVSVAGRPVTVDRIWLAGLAVTMAACLWAMFRFTRFGRRIRAAAEDEKAATLLGISPQRQAVATWVTASVVMGAVAVFAAPTTQLDPNTLPFLVVPAVGAALLGRFVSFPVTAATGIAIGSMLSMITFLQTKAWWPQAAGRPIPGVGSLVTFVVIIGAVTLRGGSLPRRGQITESSLPACPSLRRPGATIVGLGSVAAVLTVLVSYGWREAILNSLITGMLCLSLVVLTGMAGQLSLAQVATAGLAGYSLSKLGTAWGLGFPMAPLVAIAVATLAGVAAGLPALRVRGVNLAVVSLGAAVALQEFVFRNPTFGDGYGSAPVDSPALFGVGFGPTDRFWLGDDAVPSPRFVLVVLVVFAASAYGVARLRSSELGRDMLAVRANERAAAAVGVDVRATKLIALAVASLIASTSGTLSGYKLGQVTPATFGVFAGLMIVAVAYLGGITSIGGAVVGGAMASGGVVFYVLQHYAGVAKEFELIVGGVGLLATVVLNPDGVAGRLRRAHVLADRLRGPHRSPADPATIATVMTGGVRR
ncbi:ABC transporter permease [Desertimonas flava]|uniref:ABC transporter permease n=1 Tax=Desertimonas flava TaxID=2064846 RepID=UPI0013C517AF|nr:ABC transporter permease [Desertimonas flava]